MFNRNLCLENGNCYHFQAHLRTSGGYPQKKIFVAEIISDIFLLAYFIGKYK